MSEPREGWVGTINSRKWHYVVGFDALCGVRILGGVAEQGNDSSPDNCAACKRKLAKRREKQTASNERGQK